MHIQNILPKTKWLRRGLLAISAATMLFTFAPTALAADNPCDSPAAGSPTCCGSGERAYQPSIDLNCTAKGDNPIMDLAFAIIRFLSLGVGLVIVGSMTYAGIQYIGSRGDPNAHAQAIKRIQANVTALLIFIFSFAIINYVVPGVFLQ